MFDALIGIGLIVLLIYLHFKFWSWVGEKIGNAIGGVIDFMYDSLRQPVEHQQSHASYENVHPEKTGNISYSEEDFDKILKDIQSSKPGI